MSGRIADGIPEADYHSGPELSVSGAKDLLKSPALYRWRREHRRPEKRSFDLGSALHTLALGTGYELAVIEGGNGRGKREDAARAEGKVPVTQEDYNRACAMRDALRAHRTAGGILADGQAEQSIFWTDEATGVDCRARVDWLHAKALVDLKTTKDASPSAFGRDVANYRYDMQAAAYSDGYYAATGEALPFLFVAVESEPPHFVAVYQLDDYFLDRGAAAWRDALDLFRACTAADSWPAYGDDIHTLTPPRWAS